jgi:hypothetical protein
MVRAHIENECPANSAFIELNLESKRHPITTENDLYNYVATHASQNGRTYIFLDEPQRLAGWQNAVNAMRVDFDCDIYLTGSNAYLLSSELSTYLSGRYVETEVLPLVFSEYLTFCGLNFAEDSSVTLAPDGAPVLFDDVFENFLHYGGFPAIASLKTDQARHSAYMSSVYDAIAVRDIIKRERAGKESLITNADLLKDIAGFLADNVGNMSSAAKIAGALTEGGAKTTNKTVTSYLKALSDAYLFYQVTRYDLHGKEFLKTQPKLYIVDTGLRSMLMGYRFTDAGRVFENAVFLQLKYMGYSVHVGKLYQKEVDFVAERDGKRVYIQVADEMVSAETRERELAPLRAIKDAYRKVVVARTGSYDVDFDGIEAIKARDFFLQQA